MDDSKFYIGWSGYTRGGCKGIVIKYIQGTRNCVFMMERGNTHIVNRYNGRYLGKYSDSHLDLICK